LLALLDLALEIVELVVDRFELLLDPVEDFLGACWVVIGECTLCCEDTNVRFLGGNERDVDREAIASES
jgi:hypothetical protein